MAQAWCAEAERALSVDAEHRVQPLHTAALAFDRRGLLSFFVFVTTERMFKRPVREPLLRLLTCREQQLARAEEGGPT